MSSLNKRIERLERAINPSGPYWQRLPYVSLVEAWRAAHENGLYLDLATGQQVTLEALGQIDPVRADRIRKVLNDVQPSEAA